MILAENRRRYQPYWGSGRQVPREGAGHRTTRRQNAHSTEERALFCPWHPWSARQVPVHDVIEKAGIEVYGCSRTGSPLDCRLDVPAWMFDRAAGAGWRIVDFPRAEVGALRV